MALAVESPVDTPEKLVNKLIQDLHSNAIDSFIASCVICSPETRTAELQKKEIPVEVSKKCTQKLKTLKDSLNTLKVTTQQTVSDENRWLAVDVKTHLNVKRGYQKTDIYFAIQDDTRLLWIKLDDCFQVNGIWYMTEPVKISVIRKQ